MKKKQKKILSPTVSTDNDTVLQGTGVSSNPLPEWKLKKKITGDYIAGFVQADGSFSVRLARKTRGLKEYLFLSLVFTIVQKAKYKNLILEIQKVFKGVGTVYFDKNDDSVRYQVTTIADFINVIIPFFMTHQLRSGKLQSFLRFKYVVEMMAKKAHRDRNILVGLIVIASHMNPLGKIFNNVKYLTEKEQECVQKNVQPEGVDVSGLTDSINNFKQNKLTLDFMHGLFDGDGSLSVSLSRPPATVARGSDKLSVKVSFVVVQDLHNLSLLDEIKEYFDNEGAIAKIGENCSTYSSGSQAVLESVILPKMAGESKEGWRTAVRDCQIGGLNLPPVKHNKIYYVSKILFDKENTNEIIRHSYNVIKASDEITLEEYVQKMELKLGLSCTSVN